MRLERKNQGPGPAIEGSAAGAASADGAGDLLRSAALHKRQVQRKAERASGGLPHQAELEHSFGADLSSVEAQTGRARELGPKGAAAATRGERIEFADANPPKEVVAHEVAHVMQNRRAGASGVEAGGALGADGGAAEVEADTVASRAAQGGRVAVHAAPGGATQLLRFKQGQNLKLKDGRIVTVLEARPPASSKEKPKPPSAAAEAQPDKAEGVAEKEKAPQADGPDEPGTTYFVSDAENYQFAVESFEIVEATSDRPAAAQRSESSPADQMGRQVLSYVNQLVSTSTSEAEKTVKLFRFLHDNAEALARGKAERIHQDFERLQSEFDRDTGLRMAMTTFAQGGGLNELRAALPAAPPGTLKARLQAMLPPAQAETAAQSSSSEAKPDEHADLRMNVEGLVGAFADLASILDTELILPFAQEWEDAASRAVPGLGQPIVESMGDVLGGKKGGPMLSELSGMSLNLDMENEMETKLPQILQDYLRSGQIQLEAALSKLQPAASAASSSSSSSGAKQTPEAPAVTEGKKVADAVNQKACYPGRVSGIAAAVYSEPPTSTNPLENAVQRLVADKGEATVDAQTFGIEVLYKVLEHLRRNGPVPDTRPEFRTRVLQELANVTIKYERLGINMKGYDPPASAWSSVEADMEWEDDESSTEAVTNAPPPPAFEVWTAQKVATAEDWKAPFGDDTPAGERKALVLAYLAANDLTKDGHKYHFVGVQIDHPNWRLMQFKFAPVGKE